MNPTLSEAMGHPSRLATRAVTRRARLEAVDADDEVQRGQFRNRLTRLLSKAPQGVIRGCFFVDLAATERPWTDTGIDLNSGDWVTTLAVGGACLSGTLDIRAGTHIRLWMRVGPNGMILRGTRNTHSFLAFESGPLYLASFLPGECMDQTGVLATPLDSSGPVNGHLSIGVLLWSGPTLRGLKQIARLGELDELIDAEIDRIRNDEPPEGWQYDRLRGPAEI